MNRQFVSPLLATLLLCISLAVPAAERSPEAPPAPRDLQESLAETAEALQLTPAQRPLWLAYRDKVAALLGDQARPAPQRGKTDAMQAIGQRLDQARNRLGALEDIHDAAARLYAALDGEQKKTADRLLPQTLPPEGPAGGDKNCREERRPPPPDGRGPGMGGGFGRY